MRLRAYPKGIVLWGVALASAAWLGSTAPALGGAYPAAACRSAPCQAQLRIGEDETKWRSIETFYPNNEEIEATLRARGRPLRLVETWGPGGCRNAYKGSGIVAVAKACGDETPLRVRAYRMKRKRIKLVVDYQAVPMMGGETG